MVRLRRIENALTGQDRRKMAEPSRNSDKNKGNTVCKDVGDFISRLSDEHRMLVVLKAQLYDSTWEPMLDDLRHRLDGKPYIFKLVSRIEDDIKRIEEMQKFEAKHNIDLADYVELP